MATNRARIQEFVETWESDWWDYIEDGQRRGLHHLPKRDLITRLEEFIEAQKPAKRATARKDATKGRTPPKAKSKAKT